MGYFDKLFGSKPSEQPISLEPTAEMMDQDRFWSIVDDSLRNSDGQDSQEAYLIRTLEKLTPAEIVGFRLRTDKLLYDTYTSEMWCAGYIMNGGCSDDGFEYFRLWVISRGREVYENAKANPDSLVTHTDDDAEFYDFESIWYVALRAFESKTGKELYDYIDDSFKFRERNYPKFNFTWSEDDPETRRAICPNLYAKFESSGTAA